MKSKLLGYSAEEPFFAYFKLFSVVATTISIVGISVSYLEWIDTQTVMVLSALLGLPFAWFYAFFWIGYFEKRNKILPILLSGMVMIYFYTAWIDGLKDHFDNVALSGIEKNPDYLAAQTKYNEYGYDSNKYQEAVKAYESIEAERNSHTLNREHIIASLTVQLNTKKLDENGKKTDWYKAKVEEATFFRDKRLVKGLSWRIDSVHKVAKILYEKKLYLLNNLKTYETLKNSAYVLSDEYLSKKRTLYKQKMEKIESEYLKNSKSKEDILLSIIILGIFIEIILNALKLWRNIFGGVEAKNSAETVMTLLNKVAVTQMLKELNVVRTTGRHKGKVEAIYATMINIIVLYQQKEKEYFIRYKDISNKDIIDFNYIDTYAGRHIKEAFRILEDKKVGKLHLDEIKKLILEHKNR